MAVNKNLETNEKIRDREVRVVSENGDQLGIMSAREANAIADEKGLDLVKISPNTNPPVCKIMDYSKYLYDMAKKEKDARKNQKQTELKEVWLSMTIDTHDLETKGKQAVKFLSNGDKVRVSIRMKGRQQAHPEFGFDVMKKFVALIGEAGGMDEKGIIREGRNIVMMLVPPRKKV